MKPISDQSPEQVKSNSLKLARMKLTWPLLQFPVLVLLLITAVLWLNWQQSQRSLDAIQQQQNIAGDQQRETALQNYLHTISDMLIHDKLLQAQPTDAVKVVAQAQTLETLRGLDSQRKTSLLRFLYATRLINNDYHIISLADAELQHTSMRSIDLRDTNLVGANWSGSDLQGANLSNATLLFTNFSAANLANADLHATDMHNINLMGANLAGANLKDAIGISNDQLAKARSLAGTTMPDGSVHP